MLLHCTLVRGPGASPGIRTDPLELSVELPVGCPGSDLEAAVARQYGTSGVTVAGVPLGTLAAGDAPLVSGAVLVDGATAGPASDGGAALLLAVLSGPAAGTLLPLRRGSYRVGRGGTDLVVPDPELSRAHALLQVTDAGVTLVDLGSANGTTVDGKPVTSVRVSTDSVIGCGQSTLGLVFRGGRTARPSPAAGPGGSDAGGDASEPLRIPNPGPAGNRVALVLTAVVPLAVGVALAVGTGLWMFLAFSVLSAVSVLVPALSGRRRRRELKAAIAAAVYEDRDRRRRAAPTAADLAINAGAPDSGGARDGPDGGPVWLRLGLARETARISLVPHDPAFQAPSLGTVPVCLDPAAPAGFRGPEEALAGLVRFLVMQLASYPRARRTRILLHGPVRSLPLAARFLSQVSLSASGSLTAAGLAAGPGPGWDRGVLIVLPGTDHAAALCAAAAGCGWQVLDCAAASHTGPGQTVVLGGHGALLTTGNTSTVFTPDLVPAEVFDRFCRRAGGTEPAPESGSGRVPDECRLDELLPLSAGEIERRWSAAGGQPRRGLPVPVGRAAAGPLYLDLESDGPHLLVAGTTGSGKSEFLRTLVAGLAASYPPDLLNLLFADFKGGSGLGPLTGLPHCVGMLTDLASHEVERSLASLRAEVRYREELLAAAGVPDLASYPAQTSGVPALPRLVLVIDEFRMLVEEAPAALRELMRIAAIGRSLGIHLVMATQRAQGALSADIRANVTSSVVLRVQSELESADVMASRLAAAIPLDSPGRAYLLRGSAAPEEFQTAVLAAAPQAAGQAVTVLTAAARLKNRERAPLRHTAGPPVPATTEAAAPLVRLTSGLWAGRGGALPRRPVAPPLPVRLPFPRRGTGPAATAAAPGVLLGMVDVPEQQQLRELRWHAGGHGHLAFIGDVHGGTSAGPAAACQLAVEQLLGDDVESHLYILDADGSLRRTAGSSRVGAWAGADELRRAVRVLERVAGEVRSRLAAPGAAPAPPLVLVLSHWGSWVSAFRSGPLAWAEDLVNDIIRDGPGAGVTAIVSGGRELVAARFFAALPNRLFFPAGSTEESRHGWPRLPEVPALPGRVAAAGAFAGATVHAAQLCEPPEAGTRPCPSGPLTVRPFRVEPLPAVVTVSEVRARIGPELPAPPAPGWLWVGLGGDEPGPAGLPLPPGTVLAVLGGPGAGKTSLLRALPGLNPAVEWLRPGPGARPEDYWSAVLARARSGQLDRGAIALADDLDLAGMDTNMRLVELNGLGWSVVLTAGYRPMLQQRVPLALQVRGQGCGIMIAPRAAADADLFGIRFEPEHIPPPGRAVAVVNGRPAAVQLAIEVPPAQRGSGGPESLEGAA